MYFWNIKKLKTDLAQGPLPQPEQFKYLLASSLLVSVFISVLILFPLESNIYDILMSVFDILIIGIGTYYLYQCNDGKNGESFLERCYSLGWVLFIRFLVFSLVPVLFIYGLALTIYPDLPEETTLFDFLVLELWIILFYFLLGRQFKSVRNLK